MREIVVTDRDAGQRLDKLLFKYLKEASVSWVYKMMRKKNILLNGKKASGGEKIESGDVIRLYLAEETIEKFQGKNLKADASRNPGSSLKVGQVRSSGQDRKVEKVTPIRLKDIIYEDGNLLIYNKPVGLLSQKATDRDVSAIDRIIAYFLENEIFSEEDLELFRPGLCNRLDRNTSGILVCGKTIGALQSINHMFQDRTIAKYYTCIVKGIIREPAYLKGYLYKDEKINKVIVREAPVSEGTFVRTSRESMEFKEMPIETSYEPLATDGTNTRLRVHLITGKSHQIRAHLASIGHPILGDPKYGDPEVNEKYLREYGLKHQLLHGGELVFPKRDGALYYLSEKSFLAPCPEVYDRILHL